ncbi:cytochrome P450 [Exidia glandulosa HHB12029]|uniref:Cytochrome P450 n=1 Tax=Exidia glandulosa HHB12029 TaxID=1314781 RepID=A0A165I0B8_EXIGL|nr:cytochrome P450 [Exidia glandulosa HHB12029]
MTLLAAFTVLSALAVLAVVHFVDHRRSRRLPPGPSGWPILRNLLDMPKENEWLVFREWAKTYGDIMSINVLGNTIVILNGEREVKELIISNGTTFAGRMRFPMAELSGWSNAIGATSPGDNLRTMKRFTNTFLGPNCARDYAPAIDALVTDCLHRLTHRDTSVALDPRAQLRRLAGAVILRVAYGYQVADEDDKFVKMSEAALATFFASTAPVWLVNTFPIMRYIPTWMPGAHFKRQAAEWREIAERSRRETIEWTQAELDKGNALPSVAAEALGDLDHPKLLESTLADMYAGGADTTLSAITTLFLALALHPHVQERARRDVEDLVQGTRLPNLDDRPHLAYVDAMVKEVYRWRGVANLALPRRALQTKEYNGYIIPEDAIIMMNLWSIFHNPEKYPEPMRFRPERYLPTEDGTKASLSDSEDDGLNEDATRYVFGLGVRQCPGRHLADATLFILAAKTVASCYIDSPTDLNGSPITEDSVSYLPGVVSQPAPFLCRIRARDSQAELLLADGLAV